MAERVQLSDIKPGAVIWQAGTSYSRVVLSMEGTTVTYLESLTGHQGTCLASSLKQWANHTLPKSKRK